MKKLYLLFFAFFAFTFCKAQYVTIPDSGFVLWLSTNTNLTGCMNGNQLDTLCPAVLNKTVIDFTLPPSPSYPIHDLTGIKYFKNLQKLVMGGNYGGTGASLTPTLQLPSNLLYLDCSSQQLVEFPALPASLTYLNCDDNNFTSLPPLPAGLQELECGSNQQLDSLPQLPNYLWSLGCTGDGLTKLPPLPSTLQILACWDDYNITSLPALPSSLLSLSCWGCPITNLPALPSSLQSLICGQSSLTSLPALPSSLDTLDCDGGILTGLPALAGLTSLKYFDCSYNNLTVIPPLPDSINIMYCEGNQLTSLPNLPPLLNYLSCYNNKLTGLPALPPALGTLYCPGNKLTALPAFPSSLTSVICDDNDISSLPPLHSVRYIFCNHNLLTSLPPLDSILQLDCSSNKLTEIPPLPYQMEVLVIDSNPAISCMTPLYELDSVISAYVYVNGYDYYFSPEINISGTNIKCLPNRIQHKGSMPQIDTLPLCGAFNPNGCPVAWGIEGVISFDTDGNCNTTSGEPSLGNIKLKLFDNNNNLLQQVFSNGAGQYSFGVSLGSYVVKVDTTGIPFTSLCPDSDAYHSNLTVNDSLDYGGNFRLVCKSGFDLAVNGVYYGYGIFFPGRSATVNIAAGDLATYYGVNCNTVGLPGTLQAVITGPVTISSASQSAYATSTINGNTVTWNISDMSKIDFTNSFSLVLYTNTNAQAGEQACVEATISASGKDNNPANNSMSQCFTVLNSHDPNFKEVYPSSTTSPGEWLTYTIHFQNTGTASAENIYILDTIASNLDISTIQVTATSNTSFIQVLPGRIVKFSFPDIFLPDSSLSSDSSVGYVQYKIETISSLSPNTAINNTASVYFDYNAPVQTNIATSVFGVSTGTNKLTIDNEELRIYPNPTSGIVNIVLLQPCDHCVMAATDVLGRTLIQGALNGKQTSLDMSSLAAGVYYVRVSTATETQTVKIVKQ